MTPPARLLNAAASNRNPQWPLSAQGHLRRVLLGAMCGLWGGSAIAGPQFGSPAYFAQMPANGTRPASTGNPAAAPPGANVPGAVINVQQAQALSRRSVEDLARAAEAIASAQAAQNAAHQLAIGAASNVPNGLTAGGLVPTAQAALDVKNPATCAATNTCAWLNADLPSQTETANGRINVEVKQTAQKAILTWDSFNIGKKTDLHFDQHAGTQADGSNDWVALNRVTDPSLKPSQILGTIKAEGSVYVINPNGILFDGSSQVDVHTLIASSLDLFNVDAAKSNKTFLEKGIDGTGSGDTLLTAGLPNPVTAADQLILPGDITIEEGAQITTGELGFSLIAAPHVVNAGRISAIDGQAILAAGTKFTRSSAAATNASTASNAFEIRSVDFVSSDGKDVTPRSSVVNTGLIESRRGNISLLGLDVTQAGVVVATTSVSRAGSITMHARDRQDAETGRADRRGSLVVGRREEDPEGQSDSVTALLPDYNGQTTVSSEGATEQFVRGSVTLSGETVRLESNALIEAPGQNVSISASSDVPTSLIDGSVSGRVYIEDGAVIDVAGLTDVQLAMSANLVTIPRIGLNELADSPLQRDGVLYGESITVDVRNSGTRSDGVDWVGTPLANVAGYVDQVPRKIGELLQDGGTIQLAGTEVITHEGSFLNLDAGYLHYLGGSIATTQLMTAQSQVVDISKADPNIDYTGFAGVHTEEHPRWNLSDTFVNPLLSGASRYESEYVQSGDAGKLQVYGLKTTLLTGEVSAQAFPGRHQVASAHMPSGGSFYFGSGNGLKALADPLSNDFRGPSVVLRDANADLEQIATDFNAETALTTDSTSIADPDNILSWTPISTSMLEKAGFSSVTVEVDRLKVNDSLGGEILADAGADLRVRNGGSISLTGSRVTVLSDLTAQSGSISITGTGRTSVEGSTPAAQSKEDGTGPASGDIVIGSGVTLSTSGQWVNDSALDIDQQTGAAFVDGGSIALKTLLNGVTQNGGTIVDTSGSIILQQDSLLDVSSGGRILPSGRFSLSDGVMQGKGGDISLQVDVYEESIDPSFSNTAPPQNARLVLDGSLRGYGFSDGGTLSLRAAGIQIGDTAIAAPEWALKLPADFFIGQGFGAYVLSAAYDATVLDDAIITPTQYNLIPHYSELQTAATGTDLFAVSEAQPSGVYSTIGQLDDYHRVATDWSMYTGDYLAWGTETGGAAPPDFSEQGIHGVLQIGTGARIQADAGAELTLGSVNQLNVYGGLIAHGGKITLTGDAAGGGYLDNQVHLSAAAYSSTSDSIWLGSESLLDVSGTALLNPLATPVSINGETVVPRTGKLLDGGEVILTNDTGYIVAVGCADMQSCGGDGVPGAHIDVSGASTVFDLPSSASKAPLTPQTIASDAGTITLSAGGGLLFNASLSAHGGGEQAKGGTLAVAPATALRTTTNDFKGAVELQISSTAALLPAAALEPGNVLSEKLDAEKPSGEIRFYTGVLDDSGIENLRLGVDPATGNSPIAVSFAANTQLHLGRSLVINASALVGLAPTADDAESLVELSAPYVALHGYSDEGYSLPPEVTEQPSDDVHLSVSAEQIDIGGQFSLLNFGDASFTAEGDIRFLTPAAYGYVTPSEQASKAVPGVLYTAGDLDFTAAQLYPASGNTFIIDAVGVIDPETQTTSATTVSFHGNENSADAQPPLSAGGSLLVDATVIEQSGVLRAPGGQIVLGVGDVSDRATQDLFSFVSVSSDGAAIANKLSLTQTSELHLATGSLTSVSLNEKIVPYGQTVDGRNWLYDGAAENNAGSNVPPPAELTAPPEKAISFGGVNVTLDKGANVDLSGGGDLQAIEWVPGTGGSRDALSRTNTVYVGSEPGQKPLYSDGRNVYAIIPGYQGPAAYDPALVSGDPLIGQAIYLSGTADLPAGVYTLLPGKYATLPGAYRVVQDTGAVDSLASQNRKLADGSQYIAGYYTDQFTGSRSARNTAFLVQSAEVWQQYSEYAYTSANTYFPALAERTDAAVPRLPIDTGHLVLAATGTLSLGATLDASTPAGGVGALVDIASQKLQITGENTAALEGYVQVSAAELDGLNASSLLIGGSRTRNEDGDLLTAVADSVVVDNGNQTLYAPEIMLLSAAGAEDTSGITIKQNASIEARGEISALASVPITIGQLASKAGGAVSGDGSLLRVSNAAAVPVLRNNVPGSDGVAGTPKGRLSIEDGATIKAGSSVTLDSSGRTDVDSGAKISAKEIAANAQLITLTNDDTTQAEGLVIGPQLLALLADAERIALGSRGAMNFVGDFSLALDRELVLSAGAFTGDGGAVSISADKLSFSNDLNAAAPASVAGTGTLTLAGEQIAFGAGEKTLSGFENLNATAQATMIAQGAGSFDFGAADVELSAPRLLADSGANNTLRTSGAMRISGQGAVAAEQAPLGGSLSLVAGSLDVANATVQAASGQLKLQATVGDLNVGGNSLLDVSGSRKTFHDVEAYAPGGSIALAADHGKLLVQQGTVLDFSAVEQGGDAGRATFSAPEQTVEIAGELRGHAGAGGHGGSFALDAGAGVNLDPLAALLSAGGIDEEISVRTRSGDLVLTEAQRLRGRDVTLNADGNGGKVIVAGVIDASGAEGGDISLFGRGSVQVTGELLATASSAGESGGNVLLATSGTSNGINAEFGYQNVTVENSGSIEIGEGAMIDLSGVGEDSGGKLTIRAPMLDSGDIKVTVVPVVEIVGADEVAVEAYATWSTSDSSKGSQHFDGLIDPAGWYNDKGQLVAGTYTDYKGTALAANKADIESHFFTPNKNAVNGLHRDFYQHTLLDFVSADRPVLEQHFADIQNLKIRPGIDLVNPDGDISVLSNWNLGAGSKDANSNLQLAYRYKNSVAPVLNLRAAGDVLFQASISDGFFQYANPTIILIPGPTRNSPPILVTSGPPDNSASPFATFLNPLPLTSASLDGAILDADGNVVTADSTSFRVVAGADMDSADPLALAGGSDGSVTLDGHTTGYVANPARRTDPPKRLLAPTMLRTGVGSIGIAASEDLRLLDAEAPGVIYTGGVPATGTVPVSSASLIASVGGNGQPNLISTGSVNPDAAGDISIDVARDIVGIQQIIDTNASRSDGTRGRDISQYWWPWMQDGCGTFESCPTNSTINFGAFDQGILSVGGDISVSAGRDIAQLSASLPTTWYLSNHEGGTQTVNTVGGGDLRVNASRDILGGAYFVARGDGFISAGREISPAAAASGNLLGTMLALQDAQLRVSAPGNVAISGIFNPSYLFQNFDSQSYSNSSSVEINSFSGDFDYGKNSPSLNFGGANRPAPAYGYILPANLEITALEGAIGIHQGGQLYPSASGQLRLLAEDVIEFGSPNLSGSVFGLIDAPTSALPSPLAQIGGSSLGSLINYDVSNADSRNLHAAKPLHAVDAEPVRIYSLSGDIVDGTDAGLNSLVLATNKPTLIRAGRDIVNLQFSGQQFYDSDVSLIAAGRDIYNTSLTTAIGPFIQLGGIGTLLLSAGRDIGPLTSANEIFLRSGDPSSERTLYGVKTLGNQLNPYLDRDGANISAIFGVAPGVALSEFANAYVNPANSVADTPSYSNELVRFMQSYQADQAAREGLSPPAALTPDQAWAAFQQLPDYQQERLVYSVFFDVLNRTGLDYNNPDSPYSQQYARGYEAINKLFPASLGYSANDLTGASNGAKSPVATGDFDMRGSTVQTQQGGDISILGPGGNVLVGSVASPPSITAEAGKPSIPPSSQGILTLGPGSISTFTDRSVLLAQSRIFTLQGGDLLMWSSNGDLNAGKGAKTSSEIPPPLYLCTPDHYCIVDAKGQVGGAGIAALQTDTDSDEQGDVNLIAPAGTVDAGEAGIRVAGNINIAALRVANAGNIQVQGSSSGVPTSVVDAGALGAANSVGAAIDKTVAALAAERPQESAETMITVEVLGFGKPDEAQRRELCAEGTSDEARRSGDCALPGRDL